jgi:manganese/iron transport system ATP-binding protein
MTNATMLTVANVSVELGGRPVLQDISFEIGTGTLMGVVGPNGGGKSTLFNVIAGLLHPSNGRVILDEGARKIAALAYVPQRESVNWRFPATVLDVVSMGRTRKRPWYRRPTERDIQTVAECLDRVGLWEQRSVLMIELSGGQRQRVFVARALAQEAEILLLDEAFSGVDVGAQESLVGVLQSLRDDGKIVLLATHDLTNLAQRFDQVLCLNHHVCAFGPPDQAFTPEVLEELYGAHGINFARNGAIE